MKTWAHHITCDPAKTVTKEYKQTSRQI